MISTAQWIACRWRKRWCHNTTHQLECKRGLLLRCYDIESSARVCERESALSRCVIYNMSKCAIVKRSNKIARDEWIFYESKTDWCTSNNILFYSVFHFRCVCERVYVLYICSSLQRDMNTLVSAKHACEHWIRIFSRISVYAKRFFYVCIFRARVDIIWHWLRNEMSFVRSVLFWIGAKHMTHFRRKDTKTHTPPSPSLLPIHTEME